MISDREAVLDYLEMTKHGAPELTKAAMECSNQSLRQTFLQMRNECEQSQQQAAQIAMQFNWYLPAGQADQQEIQRIRSFYSGAGGYGQSQGQSGYAGYQGHLGYQGMPGAQSIQSSQNYPGGYSTQTGRYQ